MVITGGGSSFGPLIVFLFMVSKGNLQQQYRKRYFFKQALRKYKNVNGNKNTSRFYSIAIP